MKHVDLNFKKITQNKKGKSRPLKLLKIQFEWPIIML